MTSEGYPYAVFRRAVDNRNAAVAWSVAAELEYIGLEDALALCVLTAKRAPARFERAAARWIARYLDQEPRVELTELRLMADLLTALSEPQARPAARALRELFVARGRADLAGVLDSFGRRPGASKGGEAARGRRN
jgi:hypothetical protein